MAELISRVPRIDWVLGAAIVVATLLALPASRRGGRYRGLPGWVAFSTGFAVLLLVLAHAPRWVSFPLLGVSMFAALRSYFFVAPVRTRDRYAVLATYLAIPAVLYPAYIGSQTTFLATVPVSLFLFIPVFLAIGSQEEEGMLDSMGRTLLGVVFFVFCTAHLSLMTDVAHGLPGQSANGIPQLFGILVLASELPRRLAGDFGGRSKGRAALGALVSLPIVIALGHQLGPWCGLVDDDGARAGALVLIAVTLGALVSSAVSGDLARSQSSAWVGRGALIGRTVPALYAAPVYVHYLNHFA